MSLQLYTFICYKWCWGSARRQFHYFTVFFISIHQFIHFIMYALQCMALFSVTPPTHPPNALCAKTIIQATMPTVFYTPQNPGISHSTCKTPPQTTRITWSQTHLFEGSLRQQMTLDPGERLVRVVIGLLDQTQLLSLGLVQSALHAAHRPGIECDKGHRAQHWYCYIILLKPYSVTIVILLKPYSVTRVILLKPYSVTSQSFS